MRHFFLAKTKLHLTVMDRLLFARTNIEILPTAISHVLLDRLNIEVHLTVVRHFLLARLNIEIHVSPAIHLQIFKWFYLRLLTSET